MPSGKLNVLHELRKGSHFVFITKHPSFTSYGRALSPSCRGQPSSLAFHSLAMLSVIIDGIFVECLFQTINHSLTTHGRSAATNLMTNSLASWTWYLYKKKECRESRLQFLRNADSRPSTSSESWSSVNADRSTTTNLTFARSLIRRLN